MYNPIELSKKIEKIIVKENMKKYYRFRPAIFYGGIATADVVGCNLRCKFCWSDKSVWNSKNIGKYFSSEDVSEKLIDIAESNGFSQVRISGGEPTICKKHLMDILEFLSSNFLFILETNGILLGADESFVEDLSKFNNLHVRVCIKGGTSEEFSLFTGAENGYDYQFKSLEYLRNHKVNFNIAFVSSNDNKKFLIDKIQDMNLDEMIVEEEKIKLYPKVKNRLEE